MKNYIIKLIISAILIFVISYFLKIQITDWKAAFIMAFVLSLLNTFIKPIIKLFTLPITIFTLGLFLLIINGVIVKVADYFVDGIVVQNFITAIIFSVILTIGQFVLNMIFVDED